MQRPEDATFIEISRGTLLKKINRKVIINFIIPEDVITIFLRLSDSFLLCVCVFFSL